MHEAVSGALDRLAAAGWQVRELTAPWLDDLRAWEDVLAVIVATGGVPGAPGPGPEPVRRRHPRPARVRRDAWTTTQYARALERRAELTAAVEASLAGVDALAGPTVGYQAPEQDPPFGVGDDNGEGRFTGPYNLTGHPAVSLPVPHRGPARRPAAGRPPRRRTSPCSASPPPPNT